MKELNLSFDIRIALKRHDVHWIEDELLKLREETFLKVFREILVRIEQEAWRLYPFTKPNLLI